ncbi:unnamed protein product [Cunninghamella blakesleeana]
MINQEISKEQQQWLSSSNSEQETWVITSNNWTTDMELPQLGVQILPNDPYEIYTGEIPHREVVNVSQFIQDTEDIDVIDFWSNLTNETREEDIIPFNNLSTSQQVWDEFYGNNSDEWITHEDIQNNYIVSSDTLFGQLAIINNEPEQGNPNDPTQYNEVWFNHVNIEQNQEPNDTVEESSFDIDYEVNHLNEQLSNSDNISILSLDTATSSSFSFISTSDDEILKDLEIQITKRRKIILEEFTNKLINYIQDNIKTPSLTSHRSYTGERKLILEKVINDPNHEEFNFLLKRRVMACDVLTNSREPAGSDSWWDDVVDKLLDQ